MSIAIMQPYVFPYIGYFQLIHATDIFVFYDDVNYINRGWINRNRILVNGQDQLITIPCRDASQNKLIMDVDVADDPKGLQKVLTTIQMAYGKAPQFTTVFPLIESIVRGNGPRNKAVSSSVFPSLEVPVPARHTISEMAINSVLAICEYLGVQRSFKVSSEHYNNRELKKADRLLDICHLEGQTHYVNAAGGKEIYTKEYFSEKGVQIDFLSSQKQEYKQFNHPFVPWLSIIDILMFNTREEIVDRILPSYTLE